MFDSQTLSTSSTASVYSGWFPRVADYAASTVDVAAISGTSAELVVRMFHKNQEDTGDGVDVDSSTTIAINSGTAQRITTTWPVQSATGSSKGFKEMVRYKYTFTSSGAGSVSFRVLDPIWFDNVASYT